MSTLFVCLCSTLVFPCFFKSSLLFFPLSHHPQIPAQSYQLVSLLSLLTHSSYSYFHAGPFYGILFFKYRSRFAFCISLFTVRMFIGYYQDLSFNRNNSWWHILWHTLCGNTLTVKPPKKNSFCCIYLFLLLLLLLGGNDLIVIYKNSEGTINRTVIMHHINMFSILKPVVLINCPLAYLFQKL